MDTVVYVDEQRMLRSDCTDAHAIWTFVVRKLDKDLFRALGIFCCEYSLEVPWRGVSNEYQQHMILCRNNKNIHTSG